MNTFQAMKPAALFPSILSCRRLIMGSKFGLAGCLMLLAFARTDAAVLTVGGGGEGFTTIQAAVTAAEAGDVIRVSPGNYTENITISKDLTLESTGGRSVTTITGISGVGASASVRVTSGRTAFTLGGEDRGFTIIGIDNGSPGIENAAVYFQGGNSNVQIIGNEIIANGDHALVSEYGAFISDWVIDGNVFSGKTFVGETPAGNGFATQFSEPNVPRQLVVLGNGGGDLATARATSIQFSNNRIEGIAGGVNGLGQEQGNQLVTLDVAASTITGNHFEGTTTRYAGLLRVRRPGTSISNNTFVSTGLGLNSSLIYVENQTSALEEIVAANSFDTGVFRNGGTTVGLNVQAAVDASPSGSVLQVLRGTYAHSVDATAKAVEFVLGGSGTGVVRLEGLTLDADDTVTFQINGAVAGSGYDQLSVSGPVVLGGAALVVGGTRVAAANNSFMLIQNTGGAAISGAFAGYAEDEGLELNGRVLRVSYLAGTGNDMVLFMELPEIVGHPESQLVFAGEDVVFNAAASGLETLSYQWLKNNVEIVDETASTLELTGVTAEDSGRYACRVSNSVGSKVTAIAHLGVITPVTETAEFNEGGNLRLQVDVPALASTARRSYQWKKDGVAVVTGPVLETQQSIFGATTRSLTLTRALPVNSGTYTCEITLEEDQTRVAATYEVVVHPKPVITPAGPFQWGVGVQVAQVIEASHGPVTFRASGLPSGVVMNAATGQLSGQPIRATSDLGVFKVTAANAAGSGQVVEFAYSVAGLAEQVGGVFNGLVERSSELDLNGLGGSVKLAVTAAGSFSGTLVLELKSYAFRGRLEVDGPGGGASGSVVIPRAAPAEALTFAFTLNEETGHLNGTLADSESAVAVAAWRNPWSQLNPATAFGGYYTAALELLEEQQGDAAYPQGHGYAALTLSPETGLAKFAGRLADGTLVTFGLAMGPEGELPVFKALYSRTDPVSAGSLHGWAAIRGDEEPLANRGLPLLDGELTWGKGASSASSSPKTYRAGIPLHELTLVGGRYQAPAAGERILDLPAESDNAQLVFSEGGLETSEVGGPEGFFTQVLTLESSSAAVFPAGAGGNPAKVTFELLASAPGHFKGIFTLKDPNPVDVVEPIEMMLRRGSYTGVVVPRLGRGVGHFLLNELPPYGDHVPQLSGQVLLEPVP